MKNQKIILALLVAGAVGAGGYGLYRLGMKQGMGQAAQMRSPMERGKSPAGRKVLYWHDPMVPGQRFDKPGKSPFMDMQLQPVYADEGADDGTVSINPRVQQNLGIRTAEVTREAMAPSVEAVGSVAYNERDVALVQARGSGYVERLHVRAALDPVRKGQPLAELYVPDWIAVQEEFLTVKAMGGPGSADLLAAARQRMRLAGMPEDQIRLVTSTGKVQPRTMIRAPISGVVAELAVREGMTVTSGAPLFRINGVSTIWVHADIPETMLAQVRAGSTVEARAPALPGTVLKGKVSAILREVNASTRTVKARIELANPGNRLVPGMSATVNFTPDARDAVLTVPTEAVIQTGKRSVVMVAQGEGRFLPVDVEPGYESKGRTEIRAGLEAGQKVVVSGQFLIDSEASLRGTATRMSEMPDARKAQPVAATHRGQGKVEHIGKDEITLSHGPIPSMHWPAMTMEFRRPASGLPGSLAVGDMVSFEFVQPTDGTFEITAISRDGGGNAAPEKKMEATR